MHTTNAGILPDAVLGDGVAPAPRIGSPSSAANVALAAAAPLLLLTYLAVHHGVDLIVAVRALLALYFIGFVPGHLCQRYLLRIDRVAGYSWIVSSSLLGSLLTPFAWYGLCSIGASVAFWPAAVAIGLVLPVLWWRSARQSDGLRLDVRDAAALWLAVGLAVLWTYTVAFVEIRGAEVAIKPHYDHGFHAAQVAELARRTPPAVVPFFAGVSGMAYHLMPHVWCDLLRQAAGTDPHTAYFHLALPLRYLLLSLACYLAMSARFGRWAGLAGTACMLAFVEPARFSFPKGWLIYLNYNYPTAFGLIIVFLILFYVMIAERGRYRGALLLCAALSGMLLFYKSLLALAVLPAVGLICVHALTKRRDPTWLALCLGVQMAIAGVFYLMGRAADLRPTLVLAPFAFVEWWWGRLLLPGTIKAALADTLATWPELVRLPVILTICVVQRFHLAIGILAYLILRRRVRPVGAESPLVDKAVVMTLACCLVGFVLFPIQQGLVWNIGIHVWALVSALCFALMGPALVDLGGRLLSRRRVAVTLATVAVLVTAGVYNTFGLRRVALWQTSGSSGYVSLPFYECCRFIADRTPADSTVLHPRYRDTIFVSLLTGRRSVFEYAPNWGHFYDTKPILADLDAIYGSAESTLAHSILQRYDVDFVIMETEDRGPTPDDALCRPLFLRDTWTVCQVQKPALHAALDLPPSLAAMPGGGHDVD
jgi:hypothetical protein